MTIRTEPPVMKLSDETVTFTGLRTVIFVSIDAMDSLPSPFRRR